MRVFKLDNVVKKADNEKKINKYLAQGFKEIIVKKDKEKAPAKKAEAKGE